MDATRAAACLVRVLIKGVSGGVMVVSWIAVISIHSVVIMLAGVSRSTLAPQIPFCSQGNLKRDEGYNISSSLACDQIKGVQPAIPVLSVGSPCMKPRSCCRRRPDGTAPLISLTCQQ